ncbi:Leucyl-tRNA synthetase [Hyphodiscus hymeniophilus]|uniref:leucine--tRNA ligase n=1 Tax=Hyphodiscus hymeniophilus TaxID=353542 RepID=A0A9P7AWX4_9HELO|nr:Leucyl-tRNA synthetase [Hyphodiscus hymeniophilus]
MVQLVSKYAGRACLRGHFPRVRFNRQPSTQQAHSSTDHVAVERKWRRKWQEAEEMKGSGRGGGNEQIGPPKKKRYILPMFPYPSGDLHMGHMRVYTISDVLSRFRRMQGYDVIHPIGWDAFGLPAENAAIERGVDPAIWTVKNIERMKQQLQAMNCHWDWDREFRTCDPNFYKHTQRLFLLLHSSGLAYQAESLVNYDPIDKTVLANEQVDANGKSWRSGAKVEKRMLKQWFLKISKFREDLLADLESLEGAWPERVLAMQKNWLGKSTGARIKFPVIAYDQRTHSDIEVFTTRPDTLFGVQYIALASTHPIVQELAKEDVELQAFLDTMPALPPDSKIGYVLPNIRAINPLAYEESTPDATKASLPIYVTPYVLGDYGDGAVMGVPGHDGRDHAFWKHNHYDEPIRLVIAQSADDSTVTMNEPFIHHGHLTSHNGPYAGLSTAEASKTIVEILETKGLGSAAETWRLRDWLISRQRYWGTPIPIIHCNSCGPVPVPVSELPVELPSVEGHWLRGKAGNPLEDAHDWVNTSCPKCGGNAKRDTDTMDTFVDSSWYFMRFIDPHNKDELFDSKLAEKGLPVDLYIGGVEHAILHLLYARFISKFVATTSLWESKNDGEPFKELLAQGMVHGKTYSDPANGRFLKPNEVDLSTPTNPIIISSGSTANLSFEKMSKSKYNGVDPMMCMERYSADATRAHILFQAPVSEVLEWDEEKITGITRWFQRIYDHIDKLNSSHEFDVASQSIRSLAQADTNDTLKGSDINPKRYLLNFADSIELKKAGISSSADQAVKTQLVDARKMLKSDKKLWRAVQSAIMSVTESYSSTYSLNIVISDLMSLTKTISETECFTPLQRFATIVLIQLLAPIAPATAEECWSRINPTNNAGELLRGKAVANSVFDLGFPEIDGTYDLLAPDTQTCAVQINGKLRFTVEIPIPDGQLGPKELETWMVSRIMGTEEGQKRLVGPMDVSRAKKVIVVRGGKTVNFVI